MFGSTGVFLSTFGSFGSGDGEFSGPSGVAIDPTTHNIVVTDFNNARVQIFDSSGNYLSQFSHVSEPFAVAIDPATRNIVVVDNTRVVIFDSNGVLLNAFGTLGTGNGQFKIPIGVAIDPATHNIVVTDADRHTFGLARHCELGSWPYKPSRRRATSRHRNRQRRTTSYHRPVQGKPRESGAPIDARRRPRRRRSGMPDWDSWSI